MEVLSESELTKRYRHISFTQERLKKKVVCSFIKTLLLTGILPDADFLVYAPPPQQLAPFPAITVNLFKLEGHCFFGPRIQKIRKDQGKQFTFHTAAVAEAAQEDSIPQAAQFAIDRLQKGEEVDNCQSSLLFGDYKVWHNAKKGRDPRWGKENTIMGNNPFSQQLLLLKGVTKVVGTSGDRRFFTWDEQKMKRGMVEAGIVQDESVFIAE